MPRLGSSVPIVARAEEMRLLRARFARAVSGDAGAVLLSGDAGVGKTRLLSELGEYAHSAGALVLTGRCLDLRDGGLPYLPFGEAFAGIAESDTPDIVDALRARPALARLLPQPYDGIAASRDHVAIEELDHDGHRRPIGQDLGQLQLFDAVLGVLTKLAAGRPLVLQIEDVHWADGSTRDLISFLVSRLHRQKIFVIASYRNEDVHRRHPLRGLLAELSRSGSVERLELRALRNRDARRLVFALTEWQLPSDVVANIIERSEGNPFFIEELLAAGTERTDLPSGLADVLLARIERLPADTRRVLRAVAVASQAVAHAALLEVTGMGEAELDEALREAVQHHVLVVEGKSYALRHSLLREAIYADLLPGERTRLHRAYARRILAQREGKGRHGKLAYHSMQSNDIGTALSASIRATDEAERIGAPGAAFRYIEQALGIWDAVNPQDRPSEVDELRLVQDASYFASVSGQFERSLAYARSAVELATSDVPRERVARIWRKLAELLMWFDFDQTHGDAVDAIESAWDLLADDEPSAERSWVLGTRGSIMRTVGRLSDSLRSAQTAADDARLTGAKGAEAFALTTLGTLADSADKPEEARQSLRTAQRIAAEAGALNVELRARYFHALSYADRAELAPALELYRQALLEADKGGLAWSIFGIKVHSRYMFLRYVAGQWLTEDELDDAGVAAPGVAAALMNETLPLMEIARGRFLRASNVIAEMYEHRHADLYIGMAAGAAEIESAYWQQDYQRAIRCARDTIDMLDNGKPIDLGGIRVAALGLIACADEAARARVQGEDRAAAFAVSEGKAFLEHARLCVHVGRPRSGSLGQEGKAWHARAEAAASGLEGQADPSRWAEAVRLFEYGACYEQAICQWRCGMAQLDGGGVVDYTAIAERLNAAHEVAQRLAARPLRVAIEDVARRAGIKLPGVVEETTCSADPLTGRERAVLERVALGRTNRQVGAELYISEKTVSVHLSRAMAKLGATKRAEAVAIAYDRGILRAGHPDSSGSPAEQAGIG